MADKISLRRSNCIFITLLLMLLLLSQACSSTNSGEPDQGSPEIPQTLSIDTPAVTPTQEDKEITPTPELPSTATPTSPPPSPTLTTTPVGGLHLAVLNDEIEIGEVRDLWVDSAGNLWVAAEVGIFVKFGDEWELRFEEPVEYLLGEDPSGFVWVILGGETKIAAYDLSQNWQVFGADQGWTVPSEIEYLSPGYGDGLITDPQGRVWLATGRNDVRVFDPESLTWEVLSATDLGFTPVNGDEYQGHYLTDVELSRSQKVWVADCIGEGESLEGQGIHWTDGESWFDTPDTSAECVQDIEIDASGKMWVGGFDALLMYDPDQGYWTRFPLPPWDRRQLVTEIILDENGAPWVEVMQYGGAGPLGAVVRYHLVDDEWIKDYEGWFSSLAYSKPGVAWLCSEGEIFRLESDEAEEVGDVSGTQCEIIVDGSGRVWITNYSDLWWFDPVE